MTSLRLILTHLKYFAPCWVFASINIIVGTWVLYLPHIKLKFALNDSEIGTALFFTACGLLASIPFVPFVNKKVGIGRSTKLGIILFALAYNLPLIAPNYTLLCISLFSVGVFSGFTDVSMNALVSIIEKEEKQSFMSAAHGFFSLGGFIGASIGSLLLVQLKDPQLHMLVVSFFVVISTLILAKQYDRIIETTAPKTENTKPSLLKNIKPVLGLSVIAFIIMFNEGAVEHWSNLFLFDVVNVTQENAGIGFVVFSLTMTIGRFLGDGISNTIGPNKTLTYGCLIALFAYLLILTTSFYTSVLGYAFLGLGLSVIIPEIFRFAGKSKGINTSVAISIVSGIGFVGFLIGPVLLGFIANSSSLIVSYMVLLGLTFVAFLILQFRIKRKYA